MFQSFQSELPWAECPKVYFENNGSWSQEPECVVSSSSVTLRILELYPYVYSDVYPYVYSDATRCLQASTPTQYFWYRTTLMVSEDINSPTAFNWKIAMALVIAWILVYMCMIKGIASSGKVRNSPRKV